MRKIAGVAAITLAALTVTGCQVAPAPAVASKSVLDVRPVKRAAPLYATAPQRVTPPVEPQAPLVVAPVASVTPSPAPTAAPEKSAKQSKTPAHHQQQASAKGSSYKVKKGDTLYHIAKAEYGDGKKWTQIASANPGISPQSLKAGQTLVIP